MSLQSIKRGWLVVAIGSAALMTACKTNSNRYEANVCSSEVESLSLSLEQQVNEFTDTLRAYQRGRATERQLQRSAADTVNLCEEFRSYHTQNSCVSRDQLSGQEVQIQKDLYINECNEAAAHLGEGSGSYPPPGHGPGGSSWADQPLTQLKSREIALYITDSETVLRALRSGHHQDRRPLAFLNGQLVPANDAKEAAQRGETSCAIRVAKDQFRARASLPVVKIQDRTRRRNQSYTLITAEGFQASCQKRGKDPMTSRDVQTAFGTAIQVRH